MLLQRALGGFVAFTMLIVAVLWIIPANIFAVDFKVISYIDSAGNADTDEERLAILKEISRMPNLESALKADVNRLIEEIEFWINPPRLDYFDRGMRKGETYDFGIETSSPLFSLTLLYQARMNFWCTMEHGDLIGIPKIRRQRFDEVRHSLTEYTKRYPENRLVRMYLGEPMLSEKHYPPAPGAPEWAIYQREGLERMTDIVEWWVDNRQKETGEYGGGWGDDCEMWRWWVPVLIGFENPKIIEAQEKLSRAIMNLDYMKPGYYTNITDVEHSAEESADALTPMMILAPEDPFWSKKAFRLADFMQDLWTGVNDRGFTQFKSIYFSADTVITESKKAFDTVYHPRAVQPTLLYWLRTGDKHLEKLFTSWMDTWADATARAENGKPAGIIPSAIHWPDGSVGGVKPEWWNPEGLLYRWPSAMYLMTEALLMTYHMTKEDRYLQPIRSMAQIRLNYLKKSKAGQAEAGSEDWCAAKLGWLTRILAKYKFLSGSSEFDELFKKDAAAYSAFRFFGDEKSLVRALRDNAKALRVNFAGYTSEVRYTDRVLRFPIVFGGNGIYVDAIPSIKQPDPGLLYTTTTGDMGALYFFPLNAVRWLTSSRDIAALVTESGREHFKAQLYHFGRDPRAMAAELYLLDPGEYEFSVCAHDNPDSNLTVQRIHVSGQRTRISFQLPSRVLCDVSVRRAY